MGEAGDVGNGDHLVEHDGLSFRCRVDGGAGAPWLVFSNSLMTDLTLWDGQVAHVEDRHRVLRYDQRGHGGTGVPDRACTFDDLVADLAAILERLGVGRATIVGVSMGGVTALGLAARHPERVERLAVCDCQPAATAAGAAAWEERIAAARAGGMVALAQPTIERWFRPDFVRSSPDCVERVREGIRATPVDGFERAARALQHYDFRALLPQIGCPTLLLVGSDDGALPTAMRRMALDLPASTFVELADCGHLPNVEQPERFNATLDALLMRDRSCA